MKKDKCCKKCFLKDILKQCHEYRELNGCKNNKKKPNYGKTNQPLLRIVKSDFKDGYSKPSGCNRPSARLISNEIFHQDYHVKNKKCASNIFWLWGQFIDHDITLIDTHDEPFNIPVPKCDKYFDKNCKGDQVILFNISKFISTTGKKGKPRNYINRLTPFIDGSCIYGSIKERNDFIREFKDGLLKLSHGGLLPVNDGNYENAGHGFGKLFVGGDIRANEHIGLTAIHTLFVREHNYWAKLIKKVNCKLKDEKIYQKAKIIVEAELQAITYNEFLPLLLGKYGIDKYCGYDCYVNPQMSNLFSACCYRLHSLIPSKILNDAKLRSLFFNPHLMSNKYNIDYVLQNFMKKNCEEVDGLVVSDLRNFLFGISGQGGLDLASLNIQRGRDHAIPDYNTVRCELGLEKNKFHHISFDSKKNKKIKQIYKNENDIDCFAGGSCEKKKKYSMLGELFHKVIKEQFERIRNGDRLWYENRLTGKQICFINNTKLSDIIKRNTCIKHVPKNVFVHYE